MSNDIYKLGNTLKSTIKTDVAMLIVMVCDDGCNSLDQTDNQFRAVVILDKTGECKKGECFNNWNKGCWEQVEQNSFFRLRKSE